MMTDLCLLLPEEDDAACIDRKVGHSPIRPDEDEFYFLSQIKLLGPLGAQ